MMGTLLQLPNWVGDAILAVPALEGLLAEDPGEPVLAGRRLPLELTAHLVPQSERIWLRGPDRTGLGRIAAIQAIRRLGPARALLMTPSFSAALLSAAAAVPVRVGWAEQGRGFLLTTRVARGSRGHQHIVEEFKSLAACLGVRACPDDPALPRIPAADQEAERILREAGCAAEANMAARRQSAHVASAHVALCPGVVYGAAKQWPVERFRALRIALEMRGITGYVIGASSDQTLGRLICDGAGPGWVNLAGRSSLLGSVALLRSVDVAVCNDTGVMHMAAAVGTPVVALFGPTHPRWTGPRGRHHQVLQAACECAPCYARRCPVRTPAPCMQGISVDRVREAMEAVIAAQRASRPALFLDRDGTLCELIPYLGDPGRARLVPGAGVALRRAQEAGYRLVVVTNQSGVARGLFTTREVEAVHAALASALRQDGVIVDRFLYCPHHPEFTGPCLCRKPRPGMLRTAAAALDLDLRRSWMIGDARADVEAGLAAGCRVALVRTGYGAQVVRESTTPIDALVAADLPAAIERILS